MKYLRRFLWFITTRMFWVTLISALMVVVFYLGMNISNLYILLNDGMEARAGVVLMHKDSTELTKFFQRQWLESDQVLRVGMSERSPYTDYDIRGYQYSMRMEWMWSWPWDDVARATIVESVPRIDGKVKTARRDAALAAGGEAALTPPAWPTTRYRATLVRQNGRWKIASLQAVEVLDSGTAVPVPTATPAP